MKTVNQSAKGDHVSFTFRGHEVTGVVTRVKNDGTRTVELDDKFDDDFDEKLIDFNRCLESEASGRISCA